MTASYCHYQWLHRPRGIPLTPDLIMFFLIVCVFWSLHSLCRGEIYSLEIQSEESNGECSNMRDDYIFLCWKEDCEALKFLTSEFWEHSNTRSRVLGSESAPSQHLRNAFLVKLREPCLVFTRWAWRAACDSKQCWIQPRGSRQMCKCFLILAVLPPHFQGEKINDIKKSQNQRDR